MNHIDLPSIQKLNAKAQLELAQFRQKPRKVRLGKSQVQKDVDFFLEGLNSFLLVKQ